MLLDHTVLEFQERHTSLQHIFLFSCATHSAPTYHYEASLFTLQLIEKGLSKIRHQSELIKVSRWHLSIAITANLCVQLCLFFQFFIQSACDGIENVSRLHEVIQLYFITMFFPVFFFPPKLAPIEILLLVPTSSTVDSDSIIEHGA